MTETIVAAASVILRHAGRYLLVERARGDSAGQFAFPGGRADPDETPEATARRELREETGLEAGELSEYARFRIESTHGLVYALTVFVATHNGIGETVADDDAASVIWVTAAQSMHLDMPVSVRACIAALEDGVPLGDVPGLVGGGDIPPR